MKLANICASIILGTATVATSIGAFPSEAHAWFEVCNRSSKSISAAFAYYDIEQQKFDFLGNPIPQRRGPNGWISEGWYNLNSGECTQTYPHQLNRRNRFYYVYAESWDGQWKWSGQNWFCTLRTAFGLARANESCSSEGTWKPFREVDTADYSNYSYTFRD